MTPQELEQQVTDTKAFLATLSKDEPQEEWDAVTDFWEAIGLMETSLELMEILCKLDLDLKFLTKTERARLMTHTAEVMTFLELYLDYNEETKSAD